MPQSPEPEPSRYWIPEPRTGDHDNPPAASSQQRADHMRQHASVWLCTQSNYPSDSGVAADWLDEAITTIVTTYTPIGGRVLLLEQPNTSEQPYSGPSHSAPSVRALNRDVAIQSAVAGLDPVPDSSDTDPSTETVQWNAVIVAAQPQRLPQLSFPGIATALAPGGILAIITYSEASHGRLHDPTGPLVARARRSQLSYLDHIVLLHIPARDLLRVPSVAGRVHADLHIFAPFQALEGTGD